MFELAIKSKKEERYCCMYIESKKTTPMKYCTIRKKNMFYIFNEKKYITFKEMVFNSTKKL